MKIGCTEYRVDCGKHQSRNSPLDIIPTIGAWTPLVVRAPNVASSYTPQFRTNSGRVELRGAIVYKGEKLLTESISSPTLQPKAAFPFRVSHSSSLGFPNTSGASVHGSATTLGSTHVGSLVSVPDGDYVFLDGVSWAIGG